MKKSRRTQKPQLFLDQHIAAPGDVLLQLGEGPESSAIARATDSRFSHAAVVVAGLRIYEALDDGVLPTTLSLEAMQPPKGPVRLAAAMSDVRDAVLLRHVKLEPEIAARRFDVADAFLKELARVVGRRYADTCDVLRAAPPGTPLRLLGDWAKDTSLRGRLPKRMRGIFCSELVARAYAAVGLPLFAKTTPAIRVSPGDLFLSPFLREVPGAVIGGHSATPTPEMSYFMQAAKRDLITREDYARFYREADEIAATQKRQASGFRRAR